MPSRFFSGLFFVALAGALAAGLLLPFSVLAALLLLLAVTLFSRAAQLWCPCGGPDILVLAWLTWIPLTLFWGMSIGLGLQWSGTLLTLPLAYLAWRRVAAHPRAETILQGFLWALLLLLALWGLLQGKETVTGKPQGPFNDPNAFAGVLTLLILPLLGHYLAADQAGASRWRRASQLLVLGAGALTLFIIASRGATVALLLALLPLMWVARTHAGAARRLGFLVILAALAYLVAEFARTGTENVLVRLVHALRHGDDARVMLMGSALDMIAQRPWLGWGLGSFRLLYPRFRTDEGLVTGGGWVHNDYLQLWQEAGLPMLLLLAALVGWVAREIWRVAKAGNGDGAVLVRMGYLCGMLAIFIQAAVNFLFYFSLVSLLLGLYLGRLRQTVTEARTARTMPRAWRIAVTGYGAILAYLFAGYSLAEAVLDRGPSALRLVSSVVPIASRYEAAYWLSLLSPYHHSPHQVMGQDISGMLDFMQGEQQAKMLAEALRNMEASQRVTPCYVPFGSEALNILVLYGQRPEDFARARRQMEKNLACNPRHGLTYYFYGQFLEKTGDQAAALGFWQAGLSSVSVVSDRLLLAAAILSRTTVGHEERLGMLADRMAKTIHYRETHPKTPVDQKFWSDAQHEMLSANREGFVRMVLKNGP